jgi:hypothetical protein
VVIPGGDAPGLHSEHGQEWDDDRRGRAARVADKPAGENGGDEPR